MPTHKILANAIRFLSIDAIEQANSGHPGMPMGMADIATTLWQDFLSFNPSNPAWMNRDRFVLSNGHGAMLQYALLHLTGYDLSIDDLKAFRQLGSKTPGHPEHGDTPGIETTTGPLGQGLANAVGMALAEKMLGAHFNRDGFPVIDHYTYAFAGDGCLMEGISHEACSLAGTWELGKLIVFWDDNGISIDGRVEGWFTDDTVKRFQAYRWHVIDGIDGHDPKAIAEAIAQAKQRPEPSLLCCKTIIGFGSPKVAGTAKAHGAPLGEEEINATRKALAWDHPPFVIPQDIYDAWDHRQKGQEKEANWQIGFEAYQKEYPELAAQLKQRLSNEMPTDITQRLQDYFEKIAQSDNPMATRKSSGALIAAIAPHYAKLLGGSADLTGSNNTDWKGMSVLSSKTPDARYICYGVREFGMTAIMNGLALYGGFIPFGGTFLVFQSYCANATRMAALMKQQVIYVFTHDSIGLGEDGPTHQPVMEAATLRMTPNLQVWRPADALETVAAWQSALAYTQGPTALLLSRQSLPQFPRTKEMTQNIQRGGYILYEPEQAPTLILIATGSEVQLAIQAAQQTTIPTRVVSMPCCECFLAQDKAYQEHVLPQEIKHRIAIEALSGEYWYRFVGLHGTIIALDRFGLSAPASAAFNTLGFTVEHIINEINHLTGE
jgi:transketolase